MTDEELETQERVAAIDQRELSEAAFEKLKRSKEGREWTTRWDAYIIEHKDDQEFLAKAKQDQEFMRLYHAAFQATTAKEKLAAIKEFMAYVKNVPDTRGVQAIQEETRNAEATMTESKAVVIAQEQEIEGKGVLDIVKRMRVHTAEDYAAAIQIVAEVKAQRKVWDTARTSITKPMNEALRKTNDLFRPALNACDEAERVLKAKIVDYQERQKVERERQLAAIAAATNNGDAAAALVKADETIVPKIDGLSMRMDWTGEVVDAAALPREFMMPDWDKLLAVTKAAKADPGIPGWRGFQKSIPVVKQPTGRTVADSDEIPF